MSTGIASAERERERNKTRKKKIHRMLSSKSHLRNLLQKTNRKGRRRKK